MTTLRTRRPTSQSSAPANPSPAPVLRGRVSKPRSRRRVSKPSKPPSTSPTTPIPSPNPTPDLPTLSTPTAPIARSSEYSKIKTLLTTALTPSQPPTSLYICGTPGTGKTLTVTSVIQALHIPGTSTKPQIVSLNCAHLRTPQHLFTELASLLQLDTRDPRSALRTFATTSGPRVVIVLDEVDFLVSRDQMVLYSAFEWPYLSQSRFLLVGIANAVDLPVRLLPWLRATGCMPHVVSFKPYDATALQQIVKVTMNTEEGEEGLSEIAVKLAAKKVAAGSGDARLVLDVCRETARRVRGGGGKDVMVVAQVMERRGGGGKAVETIRALPVVQQLAVVVAANAVTFGGKKRAALGGLYESFRRMCERVKVGVVRWEEFVEMCCGALVHQGVLDVATGRGKKKSAEGRLVRLSVSVDDVRLGLEGKAFLPMLIARDQCRRGNH